MPSKDIKDCVPMLQEFWPLLKARYEKEHPGRELFLTCTHRDPAEQLDLYEQNRPGHILTRCDGYRKLSNHNYTPAKAFDLAVKEYSVSPAGIKLSSRVMWDEKYYIDIPPMIKELGYDGKIRAGAWFTFRDYPHYEVI